MQSRYKKADATQFLLTTHTHTHTHTHTCSKKHAKKIGPGLRFFNTAYHLVSFDTVVGLF